MFTACFLYGFIVAGATHVFPQDIVDQYVDVAWVLGWRVPLRGRVLIGFMSLCVFTLCESLDVENGFLCRVSV